MDPWTQHWSPQPREFKWLQSMWRCVVLSLVENKATLCQWNHCFRPQQNKQNIWQRIQFPCEQALQKLQLQETLITTHKPDFWIANKKSKFHAFSFQNTQTTRKKCAMCTTPGGAAFVPWAGFHQQAWELCFFRILLPADQRDTAMVDEILLSSQPNGNLSELDDSDSKMD